MLPGVAGAAARLSLVAAPASSVCLRTEWGGVMRGLIRHAAVVAGATVVVVLGTAAGAAGAGGPALAASRYPYTLVDPGTFGGPQNFLNLPAVPLTPNGALLGTADTTIPDADYPNFNP